MQSTQSVSEGCFLFKNASHHKENQKKKMHNISSILSEDFSTESWYKTYKSMLKRIEREIKSVQLEEIDTTLKDLVNFVKNSNLNDADNLLPTAILLTGINQSDHYAQFNILSHQIRSNTDSEVVILQSRDCSNMKIAIQKLVSSFIDGYNDDSEPTNKSLRRSLYTMQTLKAWYNNKKISQISNLVIILPDFELFNIEVFKKLVMILISYSQSLPIVIIIGVATSLSTLQNSLPYRIIYGTRLQVFRVEQSPSSLNNIIEKALFSPFLPLHFSGKVMQTLIDIFLFYDFSVSGFVQALKLCILEHYSQGNIFSLCINENTEEIVENLSHSDLEKIRRLPSWKQYINNIQTSEKIIAFFKYDEFLKLKIKDYLRYMRTFWYNFYAGLHILNILVKDLPQSLLGKQLRELYIMCINSSIFNTTEFKECWNLLSVISKDEFLKKLQSSINFLISYNDLLRNSDNQYSSKKFIKFRTILEDQMNKIKTAEMNVKVVEVESKLINIGNRRDLQEKLLEMSKQKKPVSDFTKSLHECLSLIKLEILEECLIPMNSGPPLIELFVFSDVSVVKKFVIGTPRGAVNTALNNPHFYLLCKCCKLSPDSIMPTLPDLSIAFKLHLECGKMINLFDWLQAFRSIIDGSDEEDHIDPKIQARFTRAVSELEFLGFIKSTKRKTDHVTRLTW